MSGHWAGANTLSATVAPQAHAFPTLACLCLPHARQIVGNTLEDLLLAALAGGVSYVSLLNLPLRRADLKGKIGRVAGNFVSDVQAKMEQEVADEVRGEGRDRAQHGHSRGSIGRHGIKTAPPHKVYRTFTQSPRTPLKISCIFAPRTPNLLIILCTLAQKGQSWILAASHVAAAIANANFTPAAGPDLSFWPPAQSYSPENHRPQSDLSRPHAHMTESQTQITEPATNPPAGQGHRRGCGRVDGAAGADLWGGGGAARGAQVGPGGIRGGAAGAAAADRQPGVTSCRV